MKYYGTHNFLETVRIKDSTIDNINCIFKLKIPNLLYSIDKNIIYVNYDSLYLIDNNKRINKIVNINELSHLLLKAEYLNLIVSNETSLVNFNENIKDYTIDNNSFNLNGNIYLYLSKIDTSSGPSNENIKINKIEIDGTFVCNDKDSLIDVLNVIYSNIVQVKFTIYDNTNELFKNILNNNASISYNYGNIFNISGILFPIGNNQIRLIDQDSTILNYLDQTEEIIYPILNIDLLNLKLKLYYNKNNINVLDKTTIDLISFYVPYHKHNIDSINLIKNKPNGIVFIDSNNNITFENTVLSNFYIGNNNLKLDFTNQNISNFIREYKNFELFIKNLEIEPTISYTDETIGNNIYYYINSTNIKFDIIHSFKFNNFKRENIRIIKNYHTDNTNNNIIQFFDNTNILLYLTINNNGETNLTVALLDKTSEISNYYITTNEDFNINILLGIYEFKVLQSDPSEVPQFSLLNILKSLYKNNIKNIINIPRIIELIFNNNDSLPIYINNNKKHICFITNSVPTEWLGKELSLKIRDNTNTLEFQNNLITISNITITKNSFHNLNLSDSIIYFSPPSDQINSSMIIYIFEI